MTAAKDRVIAAARAVMQNTYEGPTLNEDDEELSAALTALDEEQREVASGAAEVQAKFNPPVARIPLCVDQSRWWSVCHLNGYVFWEGGSPTGEVFYTPKRDCASRFSSARLARFFAKSLGNKKGPREGGPFVVRITMGPKS